MGLLFVGYRGFAGSVVFARVHALARGARRLYPCLAAAVFCALTFPAHAQHKLRSLTGASLDFPVQAPQPVPAGAPAAPSAPVPVTPGAHVITREQIRLAGAASIPEVLQLAPGVQVTPAGPGNWNVGLRGTNDRVFNGLLVLMDGRSLYNPLFGGVFWRQYDLMVDDIERVEVIRGPGGTLWGGNAVRGVVNIITRRAEAAAGTHLSGGTTGPGRGSGTLRHGSMLGEKAGYDVYGKYGVLAAPGAIALNSMQQWLVGGRLDWAPSPRDAVTLQADFLNGEDNRPLPGASDLENASLLARWRHLGSGGSASSARIHFDAAATRDGMGSRQARTWDLDFQSRFPLGERTNVLWGAGYRRVEYLVTPLFGSLRPGGSGAVNRGSAFVQGDFQLGAGLQLALGSRVEADTLAGAQYLPSARLLWRPGGSHTLWATVFRDLHLPASAKAQGGLLAAGPLAAVAARIGGQAGERSGWELGYRGSPVPDVTLDLALSHSNFQGMDGQDPASSPLFLGLDGLSGQTYNLEGFLEWRLLDGLRMTTSYSLFNGSIDGMLAAEAQAFAQQELEWRTYFNPGGDIQMDAALLWVDGVQAALARDYVRLDLRVGWAATSFLFLDLNLLNLLDDQDAAAPGPVNSIVAPPDFRRAVLGQLRTEW